MSFTAKSTDSHAERDTDKRFVYAYMCVCVCLARLFLFLFILDWAHLWIETRQINGNLFTNFHARIFIFSWESNI